MKLLPSYLGRLVLSLVAVGLIFAIGFSRLNVEADIVTFMPKDDPAISDALHILENHPIQDQLIIDVSLKTADRALLLKCGLRVEEALRQSSLFNTVGLKQWQSLLPEMAFHVLNHLPFMFSADGLDKQVKPLLASNSIRRHLEQTRLTLLNLDGIGQTRFIASDPLGLKDLVMARLAHWAPTGSAQIHKGQILSADGRHLLVIAESSASSTDTRFARKVHELIADIDRTLHQSLNGSQNQIVLMPLGAYRFALDNETIVRQDVHRAILFATIGIVLLLLLTFPRPYLGLLSLLPAVAGAAMAVMILSLLHQTVALMVLGFGGALISISVDHGIAYLLFMDRPHKTYGRNASREVWAVGLIAAMTTIGAFAALSISGFPILVQLGQFTALGIGFAFLFVHFVFPRIFPELPPAASRKLPLQRLVDKLFRAGKMGTLLAAGLAGCMLFFAKPVFNVSLSAMNTVSAETRAVEAKITQIWGMTDKKIFLMTEASSIEALQNIGDRVLTRIERHERDGALAPGFVPAMIFPGQVQQRQNYAAWKKFWSDRRISDLKDTLATIGNQLGFSANAFDSFHRLVAADLDTLQPPAMPQNFYALMGIVPGVGDKPWIQISALTTGPNYRPANLHSDFRTLGRFFDPVFFSEMLGQELFVIFLKMLAMIGISVAVLLFFFFLDFSLTVIALLPVAFALICTLGTLNLIGHALDLPGLMLAIVVIGMGVDYSLFFVRSYQHYGDPSHPNFGLIRTTVLMASVSTLIGFGVLATAQHALLRSAGLISLLGIGFSLLGAFLILPPVLERRFRSTAMPEDSDANMDVRVLHRYRLMEAYPRIFARFKLRYDPMFEELPGFLRHWHNVREIMDIGCGYGVPACWMLARFKKARIFGMDPNRARVHVAARAVGSRGIIMTAAAPEIPASAPRADLVMLLDMIQYLDDRVLAQTMSEIQNHLRPGGHLILRASIAPTRRFPWVWWFENFKLMLRKIPAYYRSFNEIQLILTQADFDIERTADSGSDGELVWIIAVAPN